MVKPREDKNIVEFTFGLDEPELEDEEQLKFSKRLLRELRNLDEVERVENEVYSGPVSDTTQRLQRRRVLSSEIEQIIAS